MSTRRPSWLPRWQEWSVYISGGLLIASAIGWLIFDQWVRVAGDFGNKHHHAQHTVLIPHGVAAYGFLIVSGTMIPVHIWFGWTFGHNCKSGLTFAIICILLVLTARALFTLATKSGALWRAKCIGSSARSLSLHCCSTQLTVGATAKWKLGGRQTLSPV